MTDSAQYQAQKSATMLLRDGKDISGLYKALNLYLRKENGYDIFYSGEFGYKSDYIEIKYGNKPILDLVKIPNADDYAASFYDMTEMPPGDQQKLKRLISDYFYGLEEQPQSL